MVKRYFLISLLALVTAAVVFYAVHRIFRSEETVIKRQISSAASVLNKDRAEQTPPILTITRRMHELLSDPCTVTLQKTSFTGRYSPQDIAAYVVQARSSFTGIEVSVHGINITILEPDRAHAGFTVRFRGEQNAQDPVHDIREITATLVKNGGRWRFRDIEEVEILRR